MDPIRANFALGLVLGAAITVMVEGLIYHFIFLH